MSRLRLPWKDAATVILAARSAPETHHRPTIEQINKLDHASPMTLANQHHMSCADRRHSFDYRVLMLKRSGKSGFMPSSYVFPGGICSAHDFSSQWHDYLCTSLGITSLHPEKLRLHTGAPGKPKPEIYTNEHDSILPAEVALRICAVRETFEESGILLYTDKDSVKDGPNEHKIRVPRSVLSRWRDEVNKDEGKFLDMMRVLDILPDIWGLHDYVNWLTPVRWKDNKVVAGARRYDTIFYLYILTKHIEEVHDDKEIVASKWVTPLEALEQHYQGTLQIAPPQAYELGKLCGLPQLDDLSSHVKERSVEGLHRWMPVQCKLRDGYFHLLPGDDHYPAEPDYVAQRIVEVDMTMEESAIKTKNHNRSAQRSGKFLYPECNITLPCGQRSPPANLINFSSRNEKKSKM